MPPSPLVVDIRGQAQGVGGGPARVGVLDAGLFFTQIGADVPEGGLDLARSNLHDQYQLVVRFRGLLYFMGSSSTNNNGSIYVFDEGGTNAWTTGVAAKGGQGAALIVDFGPVGNLGPLLFVQTATKDFLVGCMVATSAAPRFARFDPTLGDNGTWLAFIGASLASIGSAHCFVHNGIVHWSNTVGGTNSFQTFDPDTAAIVAISRPATAYSEQHPQHFTLYDRLFQAHARSEAVNPFVTRIYEFSLGAWVTEGATTNLGHAAGGGSNVVAFPISPTKVLLIGNGGGDVAQGLVANLVETVGDSPTGALTTSDVTDPVIPAALRPTSAVGTPENYRVTAMVDNVSTPGSKTQFLHFHPDGVAAGAPTVGTLFEVIDELTTMVDLGAAQSDSDFAYPRTYYGGGQVYDGIDGSTRLVSVQPRGFTKGTTGLIVKCSAHGDAVVLAHGVVTAGPFTVGEVLTGGSSGATAVVVGDGAAEGLYLTDVVGTFSEGETVTGGTSAANTVLDHVLNHGVVTGGPFQVGEVVTGGTSTAFGTVTHLGIGGLGETLVKVDTVTGAFVNGETITGGTSSASAVLSVAPTGQHGGTAGKKIRARFFLGAGPSGKGVPVTGSCSMVPGSGTKGTVSLGTGPGGEDELINIVADGSVGTKDADPPSFEWDFLADAVPKFLVDTLSFEIDRV